MVVVTGDAGAGTVVVLETNRVLVVRTLVVRHRVVSVQGTSTVTVITVVHGVGTGPVDSGQGDVM